MTSIGWPATSSRSPRARARWTTGRWSSPVTDSERSSRLRRPRSSESAATGWSWSTAGLVEVETATGQDVDEFLRGLDEPPEVMRSMTAYLADRRSWDPASWDADQERAARAAVVETPAGRLVLSTRPHALEACVRTMFAYRLGAASCRRSRPRSSRSAGRRPATTRRPGSAIAVPPAVRRRRRRGARPQPASLPTRRGDGGDPRTARLRPGRPAHSGSEEGRRACASSTARRTSPTTRSPRP